MYSYTRCLQTVPLATSPKSLSTKISFRLSKSVCTFQCALARIMGKILFCLVTEKVYGTDCVYNVIHTLSDLWECM